MIMGHSKHELSTKKPVLLPKKNITSLPPHKGTSPQRLLSSVPKVAVMETAALKHGIRNPETETEYTIKY